MEKMSLLEKLKTLNQWQLQQQLNLAKLQSEVNNQQTGLKSPDDNLTLLADPHADKENSAAISNDFTRRKTSPFAQTMSSNALRNVLKSVDLNRITDQNVDDDVDLQVDDNDSITASVSSEQDVTDQHSTAMNNWLSSGLQTVKFVPSVKTRVNNTSARPKHDEMICDNSVLRNSKENDFVGRLSTAEESDSSDAGFMSDFGANKQYTDDDDDGVRPISESDNDCSAGGTSRLLEKPYIEYFRQIPVQPENAEETSVNAVSI